MTIITNLERPITDDFEEIATLCKYGRLTLPFACTTFDREITCTRLMKQSCIGQ